MHIKDCKIYNLEFMNGYLVLTNVKVYIENCLF